jgi:release factor glutamine methyltransferase
VTIRELLDQGRRQIDSDSARLDSELLLAFCLQRNRSFLYAWPEKIVDDATAERYRALVDRRRKGEPIAYLIGEREFWSLNLRVDNSTLIPRPETERLVEIALELGSGDAHVLDLGTGTGAIALALAQERPHWQILGVDKSADAIALAEHNAHRHQLVNVRFAQSDWFDHIDAAQRFDLIVSNPPYIDADDPHLQQGDVRFEPRSALVAANNGLADIEAIAGTAPAFLQPRGWLLLEHGFAQGAAVRAGLDRHSYAEITTWRDDGGRERVTGGRRPEDTSP